MLEDQNGSVPTEEEILKYVRELISSYNRTAKQRRIRFDLDAEYILTLVKNCGYKCMISGIPFKRIDPSRGFTRENIRLLCNAVNLSMKILGSEFTLEHIVPALNPNRKTMDEL